jgi:hypothetical protein
MSTASRHQTRRVILAALVSITALLLPGAPSAFASEGCPNEAARTESRVNPSTGQPYSQGLPECRAYEMVTPLDKGGSTAEPPERADVLVAPEGDTVGFQSPGVFVGVENLEAVAQGVVTFYLSRRMASGWVAEGAPLPASSLNTEALSLGGFSADLGYQRVDCGQAHTTDDGETLDGYRCALGQPGGALVATPSYQYINGQTSGGFATFLGGSADLSRAFIQVRGPLLPADNIVTGGNTGIYEIAGVGTPFAELRLVNVDNNGNQLSNGNLGPLSGDFRAGPLVNGSAYHASSENGETVFFTATPTAAQQPGGGQQTVYARLHHSETVSVSNPVPAECLTCSPTPQPATYQGASADGSKVFFTTAQQLVNGDQDETTDLYMYDFANPPTHHLVQLSAGGTGDLTPGIGANVQSVVRMSSDGSHVYFVATGVLTTLPNSLGQVAQSGADNLYGVDTNTGETKFVAELCSGEDLSGSITDTSCPTPAGDGLWSEEDSLSRDAQTTLDGRYLVFSTFAHLTGADANNGQAAYRYDFQAGELTWLSHPAQGFTALNEAKNAVIAPLDDAGHGGDPDVNDFGRALTGNGEDVIFTTSEKLQADDVNAANDVYLWHDGTVSLISDGRDPAGINLNVAGASLVSGPWAGISESGSDIFFFTRTELVGQDTDVLGDLYDARIDGGFPAPAITPSCTGEAWTCQGKAGENPPAPKPEGSATQQSGSNLTAAPFKELLVPEPKPKSKPLTNAQKLKAALQKCRKLKGSKRKSCERAARSKYAPKPKKR